jgi:hypothetical protein
MSSRLRPRTPARKPRPTVRELAAAPPAPSERHRRRSLRFYVRARLAS